MSEGSRRQLSPSSLYLFFYNSFQAFGWSVALYRLVSNFVETQTLAQAYSSTGNLICLFQTVAFLEVSHGAIGDSFSLYMVCFCIVPSGVLLPLMQWGGRTHFLLAIVRRIDKVQTLPSVFITFAAWSISEVIRYSQYACSCIRICPYWLTYLRYPAFIVLYLIGVGSGEMLLMYRTLSYIKAENLYERTFNKLHVSYHGFVVTVLAMYPLLWLQLYTHMFHQRRSKLKNLCSKKY